MRNQKVRRSALHKTSFFFYALIFAIVLQAVLSILQGNILEMDRALRATSSVNLLGNPVIYTVNFGETKVEEGTLEHKGKGNDDHQHKPKNEVIRSPEDEIEIKRPNTTSTTTEHSSDTQRIKNAIQSRSKLPLLILGGSDGSGTRAFVDVLGHLHVPMLVDDQATLDIHAPCFYHGDGWPHVVNRVMNETHLAHYEFADLPEEVQQELHEQMRLCFREHYAPRAMRLLVEANQKGKDLPDRIQYGFKAPVSMLLLPVLLETFETVKFLHVIRDGRDIALSSNTSPVDKFYQTFYPNATEQETAIHEAIGSDTVPVKQVMAMQLWNDWNTQVYEFGTTHPSIDYLPIKTEDLLSPDTRFEAIQQIADFVGSPLTMEQICCLSQRELHDMGKSMNMLGEKEIKRDVRKQLEDKGNSVVSSFLDAGRQIRHEKQLLTSELDLLKQQGTRLRKQMETAYDVEDTLLEQNDYEKKLQDHRQEIINNIPNQEARKKFRLLVTAPKQISVDVATPDEVKQRYGKWMSKLEHLPQLSQELHRYGAKGLELFGYAPSHEFLSRKYSSVPCFICAE